MLKRLVLQQFEKQMFLKDIGLGSIGFENVYSKK